MKMYSPTDEGNYIEVEFSAEAARELVLAKYNRKAKFIKENLRDLELNSNFGERRNR